MSLHCTAAALSGFLYSVTQLQQASPLPPLPNIDLSHRSLPLISSFCVSAIRIPVLAAMAALSPFSSSPAAFFLSCSALLLLCSSPPVLCLPLSPAPPNASSSAGTVVGFYRASCPEAETIVQSVVQKRFLKDKTITPALLRMLFHDSFVRGADASIMLSSKATGNETEKDALPNLTIRGFDLIDEIKEALEAQCPVTVSCADILVLATRDAVALAGGPKYEVPTGRLDGKVSLKEEALTLPSPAFPVEQSRESFIEKGLDADDMVALLGAHTVGVALCGFFNDRLFNFHGTGAADPNMNPSLVTKLSTVCPNPFFTESDADPPINLDQSTPTTFDAAYFHQIQLGNGILQIDQEITADPTTAALVQQFTSAEAFFPAFARSIVKMSNIGVITGAGNELGEVRRQCNATNAPLKKQTSATGSASSASSSSSRPMQGHGHHATTPVRREEHHRQSSRKVAKNGTVSSSKKPPAGGTS